MNDRFTSRIATYLILVRDNKILLSRRSRTGWQDGNYSLPSGHLDGNETVRQAMSREAFEELGIQVEPKDLKVLHVMHMRSNQEYIVFYLTTTKWKGEVTNKEPEKCSDLDWFNFDQLPQNTLPNVLTALENIKKKIIFSEIGWD